MTTEQMRVFGLGGLTLVLVAGSLYVLRPDPVAPTQPAQVEPPRQAQAEPAHAPPPPGPDPVREALPPQAPPQPPAEAPRTPDLPLDPRERLRALEPLRREVFAGLKDLDGRIEACRLRDASLRLTLETLDGRVRVLRVRVVPAGAGTEEATGAAPIPIDEGAARCVVGALERTIVSAPSAKPGRQWEMSWGPGMSP